MGMTTETPSGIAFTLLIILIFKCLVKFENFKEDNVSGLAIGWYFIMSGPEQWP
jgi:hypothetical protein